MDIATAAKPSAIVPLTMNSSLLPFYRRLQEPFVDWADQLKTDALAFLDLVVANHPGFYDANTLFSAPVDAGLRDAQTKAAKTQTKLDWWWALKAYAAFFPWVSGGLLGIAQCVPWPELFYVI